MTDGPAHTSDGELRVSPSVQIVSLDHVQVAMPAGREEEARAFYAGVLGMTEIPQPALLVSGGGCWFQSGDAILHLGIEDPFAPARKAHPAFVVADLDVAARALKAAGAPVAPDSRIPGVQRFHTADPFGNRIELMNAPGADPEALSVTFQLNREDLVRYTMLIQSQPVYQRMSRTALGIPTIMGVLFALIAMNASLMGGQSIWISLLLALGCGAAYIKIVTQNRRRSAQKQVDSGVFDKSLAPSTISLGEGGIRYETDTARVWISWRGLTVQQAEEYIFIFTQPLQALCVPKRAFTSDKAATAFYVFARRHIPTVWRCRSCGYDLRGNQSGRCPECSALA